jgi:hypothetical protein
MPKRLDTWVNEIKAGLELKGYKKDIPFDLVKAEFMIHSGYGKKKTIEWINNFRMCRLILVEDDKVNFK